jgi:tetratricopeptide (TPR) repeat protein
MKSAMCDRKTGSIAVAVCLSVLLMGSLHAFQMEASVEQLSRIQQQIRSGDLTSASNELDQAMQVSPSDPRLFNFRGVVEAKNGQFDRAAANFRKAITLAPGFPDACLNLGRLYQENAQRPGALDNALRTYLELLAKDPGHVEANYQAASLLTRRGSYSAALQHLSRLPAELQQHAATRALRCANMAGLGRKAQTETSASELLSAPGLTEIDVLSIVPVLLANHSDDVAVRLLIGLQTRSLASAAAFHHLAAIQEKKGRIHEARAALESSPEMLNPSAGFLSRVAQLAYEAKDPEGALGYLARARTLEPENSSIHFFFGIICVDLKLPPEAKASLREAVRLQPENPFYNYALGAILVGQKNPDEAIGYFRKYRDARPRDPRGAFALGVAYFEAYELDAARQVLESVANNPETRSGAQLYLGRVALSSNQPDAAASHFLKAIQVNPKLPDAYAELALIRMRRGDYALAQKDLASALAVSPDHYLSNLRLLMLYQRTRDPGAEGQKRRVDQLREKGEEKERLLLRSLDIRPY